MPDIPDRVWKDLDSMGPTDIVVDELVEKITYYRTVLAEIQHGTSDTWAETRAKEALLGVPLPNEHSE